MDDCDWCGLGSRRSRIGGMGRSGIIVIHKRLGMINCAVGGSERRSPRGTGTRAPHSFIHWVDAEGAVARVGGVGGVGVARASVWVRHAIDDRDVAVEGVTMMELCVLECARQIDNVHRGWACTRLCMYARACERVLRECCRTTPLAPETARPLSSCTTSGPGCDRRPTAMTSHRT